MQQRNLSHNIVLIDDDFIIRQVLKSFIGRIDKNLHVYSSANGVEGLGFVITTNPSVVIIDTTLPKYSGRELIDYLSTNPRFTNPNTMVLVIQEKRKKLHLPDNYVIINKKDRYFLDKLIRIVSRKLIGEEKTFWKLKTFIGRSTIKCANKSDLLMHKGGTNPLRFFKWLWYQITASIYLTFIRLFLGKGNDYYIEQKKFDLMAFRVRYYPTFATISLPILFLFFQLFLFVAGGLSIASLEVNSIFASEDGNKEYVFTNTLEQDYEYTNGSIVFESNGAVLKKVQIEHNDNDPSRGTSVLSAEVGEEETPSENEPAEGPSSNSIDQSSENEKPEEPQIKTIITEYKVGELAIIETLKGVPLTRINNLTEEVKTVDTNGIEAVGEVSKLTEVRYQLSMDRKEWWYLKDGTWQKGAAVEDESNSLEEVVSGVANFSEVIGGNELYFRIFLITKDSGFSPKLLKLIVGYEKPKLHIEEGASQLSSVDPTLSEYYVDGAAGDDNNTGTAIAPLQTIQAAADVADAGDTVYVKGGITYAEDLSITSSGALATPITYTAWPGTGRPTVNTTNLVIAQSYIRIIGFNINATTGGVSFMGNINGTFQNNILDAVTGVLILSGSNNFIVSGNLIITDNPGIYTSQTSNVHVINNTIIGAGSNDGISYLDMLPTWDTITIENNIIQGFVNGIKSNNSGVSTTINNNLFYNNTLNNTVEVTLGTGNLTTDPLFVNAGANDYRLQGNSSAIDAGFDTTGTITTDIVGRPRSIEGGVDIGAYENLTKYYVAGDMGSDSNYGTESSPYKTIQKAADQVVAANTVYVKGGITYTSSGQSCGPFSDVALACIEGVGGSSGNPIIFSSWPGTGTPIIETVGVVNSYYVNNVDYIVISGFKMILDSGTGVELFSSDNSIIRNNIIVLDVGSIAIGVRYAASVSNGKVFNNTFWGNNSSVSAGFVASINTTNAEVKNNIFAECEVGVNADNVIVGANVTSDYNLFYSNGTNHQQVSAGANEIYANPLFKDSNNGDFGLQYLSPAINSATTLSGMVDDDILGYNRSRGGAYDIGAYEDRNIFIAGDTGNDTTGDGSATRPWKTIQKGADEAWYGDTVHIKGNLTYTTPSGGNLCPISGGDRAVVCIDITGTEQNPVTFKAWDGTGIPAIDGGAISVDTTTALTIKNSNYINIDGLKVKKLDGASYLSVTTFRIQNSNNVIVTDSIIEENQYFLTYINVADNVKLINNTFYQNTSNDAIDIFNATNVELTNNVLFGQGGSVGVKCYSLPGVSLTNNLIHNFTTNVTGCGTDTGTIAEDPQFLNAAGGDFRLMGNSPAIDSGIDVSATISTDISEKPRFLEGGVDRGAYENIVNYYVADDVGNDANLGLETEPFKTVRKASEEVLAGGIVHIKGSLTYSESNINTTYAGTPENYITYRAWEGTGIPELHAPPGGDFFNILNDYAIIESLKFTSDGIRCIDTTHSTIIRNSIFDSCNTGAIFVIGDSSIYNNVFYENETVGLGTIVNLASNTVIRNNIFMNNQGPAIWTLGGTVTTENNIFIGNDEDCRNCTLDNSNIVNTDPQMVDPVNGNYQLMGNSPAIDSGYDVMTALTTDIIGRPRLLEEGVDMGAYENIVNYYVADDIGDDSNMGLITEPFKTIQAAADAVLPGGIVNVKGGLTYSDSHACKSLADEVAVVCLETKGTSNNYITYKPWAGTGTPIIDTAGIAGNGFTTRRFSTIHPEYTIIEGFRLIDSVPGLVADNQALLNFSAQSKGMIARNNIIIGAKSMTGLSLGGSENLVYNNTILGDKENGANGAIFSFNANSGEFKNNIIVRSKYGISDESGLVDSDYNLLYDNDTNYQWSSANAHDIVNQDPLFHDSQNGNYHITKYSPAVDSGDDSKLAVVINDIEGIIRPQSDHIDIGAYEFYDDAIAAVDIIRVGIVDVIPANEIEFTTSYHNINVTGNAEPNATVYFVNKVTGEVVKVIADSNGDFVITLSNELGTSEYYYYQIDDWGNESVKRLLRIIVVEEGEESSEENGQEPISTTSVTTLPDTGDGSEEPGKQDESGRTRIKISIEPIIITVPLIFYLMILAATGGIGSTSIGDFFLKIGVLFGVVIKRKKKYWGVVFDAQESKPIPFAVVRLLREDSSLIKQTVTDLEGRYSIVIDEKGLFTLEVQASGYNSYQKKINVPALKTAFIGQEVVEDVPLQKIGERLSLIKRLYCYSRPQLLKGFRIFTVILMLLGFLWSVYVTWRGPNIINLIILGVYGILFALNLYQVYLFRRRNAGRVIDETTGEGVGGVGVRIYEEGKQLEMVLTTNDGYLKFNFKPGVYDFYANKDGYTMSPKNNQPLQRIQLDAKGMLEEDIRMKQLAIPAKGWSTYGGSS